MKGTAGRGIEALRARSSFATLSQDKDDSRRDILTTLRAQTQPRQEIDAAPRQQDYYEAFRDWLKAQGKTKATIKETVNYGKRFSRILQNGDASVLMTLSPRNRHHAMTALANLSKYQGCYDRWLDIRRRYNLKWSRAESIQAFERFFNPDLSFDAMLSKVMAMIRLLPASMAAVVRFDCLTGLRPSEAAESARLISDKECFARYYNDERQSLEHFRFPDIFLRQTKKAYLSFVTLDNLQPIVDLDGKTPRWNAIRLACYDAGIGCDMRYCRKIFASHLSACGIQSEVIDLLSGRVPQSVLARHYLTPSAGLKDRVLQALSELSNKLNYHVNNNSMNIEA